MKKIIVLVIAFILGWVMIASAQVWVRPYIRKDGTVVQGHYRSRPNKTPTDNYSYPGNINPYTGKEATGDPYKYLEGYQRRQPRQRNYDLNLDPYPKRDEGVLDSDVFRGLYSR